MNATTHSTIVLGCIALCAGGVISGSRQQSNKCGGEMLSRAAIDAFTSYQLITGEPRKFTFGQLEAIVRADAATRLPGARIEFGSVKVEQGALTMPVLLFGRDAGMQAFLYKFVPEKSSWKIASAQKLWFVPPSHLLRGLRV